jgi:hypothetical protein
VDNAVLARQHRIGKDRKRKVRSGIDWQAEKGIEANGQEPQGVDGQDWPGSERLADERSEPEIIGLAGEVRNGTAWHGTDGQEWLGPQRMRQDGNGRIGSDGIGLKSRRTARNGRNGKQGNQHERQKVTKVFNA